MDVSRKNSQINTTSVNVNNIINNNINNNNNNNNNNLVNDEKLTKIEALIKCAFESKNDPETIRSTQNTNTNTTNEQTVLHKVDDTKSISSGNMNDNKNLLSKRFETFADADEPEEKKKNKHIYPTPDILLKNVIFEKYSDDCGELEKPDILRNVYANDADEDSADNSIEIAYEKLDDEKVDSVKIDDNDVDDDDDNDDDDNLNGERKIDNPWSITPVDIVGNFKQEIEREFGLIVSGYRNTSDDMMLDAEGIEDAADNVNLDGISDKTVENVAVNKVRDNIVN